MRENKAFIKMHQKYGDILKEKGFTLIDYQTGLQKVILKNIETHNEFSLIKRTFTDRLKLGLSLEFGKLDKNIFIEKYGKKLDKYNVSLVKEIGQNVLLECKKHGEFTIVRKLMLKRLKNENNPCIVCMPITVDGKMRNIYEPLLRKIGYDLISYDASTRKTIIENITTKNQVHILKDTLLYRLKNNIPVDEIETYLGKKDIKSFLEKYKDFLEKYKLTLIKLLEDEIILNCEQHGEIKITRKLLKSRFYYGINPCIVCLPKEPLVMYQQRYSEKLKQFGYELTEYNIDTQIFTIKDIKNNKNFSIHKRTFERRLKSKNKDLSEISHTNRTEYYIFKYGEELKKYGLSIIPISKNIFNLKCKTHGIINSEEYDGKRLIADRLKSLITPCIKCHPFLDTQKSGLEKRLIEFIKEIYTGEIIHGDRKILDRQEIDIFLPNEKIGIEFNGIYWHSDDYKIKTYHKDKSDLAKEKGIFLYHFFEDEIRQAMYFIYNNIFNQKININDLNNKYNINISSLGKVYARETNIILDIDKIEALPFLEEYHLQGKDVGVYKYIGLKDKKTNELISVMTFKRGDASKNIKTIEGEFELSRYCVKGGVQLVGGFEKILKSFIKEEKDVRLIYTYSNGRYSNVDNNVYIRNGFTNQGFTGLDYFYVYKGVRYSRFSFRKIKLYELINDKTLKYNKCTEEDLYFIAREKGIKINRVFGVGNYKWVKNISV